MTEPVTPPDETLDEVYTHAPVGYLTLREDWCITRVNDTLLDWLGRPRADVVGRRFQALLTAGARIFYETHCALVLRKHGALREAALDLALPGGAALPVLGSWRSVDDARGSRLGYRVLLVDARERRNYERELIAERERARAAAGQLRALNAELEQRVAAAVAEREAAAAKMHEMQKLETIGQLTGGVAHDFNNLLAAISGSLELLRRRLPEADARARRQIEIAMQAADRGAALTQRLLAFARRQILQPRPVDVAALLGGLLDLLRRSIGPAIAVDLNVAADLPPVLVDANQFELALLNLAINARDAMPLGGRLAILADRATGALPAELAPGAYARVRVIDTGTGMDAETLRRAIEPFFTTKGVGKGTGLGLSMVHGLAAQSGGVLTIASQPGHGTTVTLWLPTAPVAAAPPPSPAPPAAPRGAAACVLLVDDDALVSMSVADMLADLGYRVLTAASGPEALVVLRDRAAPVALLVTDYAMPGMTGAELAAQAAEARPGLPILLISGYADLPAGAGAELSLLPKPFTQEKLAQAVGRLLRPGPGIAPPRP